MYIFLDESKALHKNWWKFILAWLVTSLKPWTIDKLYSNFLIHSWIREKWGEIKSCDGLYKNKINDFYYFLKDSQYSNNIELIWIFAKNYFENWESYYWCLEQLTIHILKNIKIESKIKKINIIADNLKLNYKQEDIKNLLNKSSKLKKFKIYKWFDFLFENSKNFWWIKMADFIAWKLRETFISERLKIDKDFIRLFVNEEIVIIKLK